MCRRSTACEVNESDEMAKKQKAGEIAATVTKALAQFQEAQAPALEVRVGILEAGLRELYAAVEGGTPQELATAMDLARGLLMDCEDDDAVSN